MNKVGMSVADRLIAVKDQICQAAEGAGRRVDEIGLIAVSKFKDAEMVRAAVAAGQYDFGENYVQEALAKMSLVEGARWHFIGALQTNKVRQVVGAFAMIHSVDRDKLLREISKEAQKKNLVQDILIELNIADEDSKSGISPEAAPDLLRLAFSLAGVRVRGLMVLPPLAETEEQARGYFRQTRELWQEWRQTLCANEAQRDAFCHLSMGTSADFSWAIAEGATLVRVGTSVFGERS